MKWKPGDRARLRIIDEFGPDDLDEEVVIAALPRIPFGRIMVRTRESDEPIPVPPECLFALDHNE